MLYITVGNRLYYKKGLQSKCSSVMTSTTFSLFFQVALLHIMAFSVTNRVQKIVMGHVTLTPGNVYLVV